MKYVPLIWSGLSRVPIRTGLTFFSIILAFVLFGILTSLTENFAIARAAVPKNILAMYPDMSGDGPGMDNRGMPLSYRSEIEKVPGVADVFMWGVLRTTYQDDRTRVQAWSVRPSEFGRFFPQVKFSPGGLENLAKTPSGMLIHGTLASKHGWKVGDAVPLQSTLARKNGTSVWTFTVVGTYDAPKWLGIDGSVIPNFDYIDRERLSGEGTAFEFDVAVADPDNAVKVSKQLDAMFASSSVPTRTRPYTDFGGSAPFGFEVEFFVRAVVASGFLMLLLLSTAAMTEAIAERMQELAVLRCIGFSQPRVLALIVTEALGPCLLGAILGLAIARGAVPLARKFGLPMFHEVTVDMPWTVVLMGLGFAVVVAILSSVMPMWRVARSNIVAVLNEH